MENKFEEMVKNLTKTELKNVRQNVQKYIESAMLNIIGLEKKYSGDYEIDHCNGRSSVLIDAFRELARDEARRIAANYKPKKEELALFTKTFQREFVNQFSYVAREVAKEKAHKIAEEVSNKMKFNVDELLKENGLNF